MINIPSSVRPGGHSHERSIRVCPAVKTPFFRLSGRSSSDPQLQFEAPVLKTPFFLTFLTKIKTKKQNKRQANKQIKNWLIFATPKAHFRPNFSSLPQKSLKNCSPYFWQKSVLYTQRSKQSALLPPPPPHTHTLRTEEDLFI